MSEGSWEGPLARGLAGWAQSPELSPRPSRAGHRHRVPRALSSAGSLCVMGLYMPGGFQNRFLHCDSSTPQSSPGFPFCVPAPNSEPSTDEASAKRSLN